MLPDYFIVIGSVISTFGMMVYLYETVRGRVQPNKVSLTLWSLVPAITLAAQLQQGVRYEALITAVNMVSPLLILLASFANKNAYWKVSRFDLGCGVISILGLVLWRLTLIGNLAILLSIIADTFASIPTLTKTYAHPETEQGWPWLATVLGTSLVLLTLDATQWNFATAGFMVYVVVMNFIIFGLAVRDQVGQRLGAQ